MKKSLALMLALIMVLCMIPTTAFAANGTGHQISVKIYKVVLDSSKPLGYQNPELVNTITVICQDATGHSGYNHSVKLKEFYPTNFGLPTTDWTGWQFDSYYTKGKDNNTFYNFTSSRVNATANVTGSEPYSCSKNFYLVYKEAAPQTQDITLTYNANGGSGAPEPQTQTVESGKEATFTVNSKEPTRTNYDFKGWSTAKNAAAAEYKGGDSITISQDTTLYAVWANHEHKDENSDGYCDTDQECMHKKDQDGYCIVDGCTHPHEGDGACCPKKPDNKPEPPKPENTPGIPGLTGDEAVEVHCTNDNANHADKNKSYGLMHGGYTVGKVQGDKENGYTCEITVEPDKYVAQYNSDINVEHELDPESKIGKIELKWKPDDTGDNTGSWEVINGVPVVFNVKCDKTQPPLDKPITIEVSKVWEDDNAAGVQSIKVGLYANGIKVDEADIVPNQGVWYHNFGSRPLEDNNGRDISYTIVEEPIDGYTPHYYTSGEHDKRLVFRVKNVPTDKTGAIRVSKELSGEGADKNKEFAFTVTLLEYLDSDEVLDGGKPGYYPLSGIYTFGGFEFRDGKVTFGLKGGQSVTISGIPEGYNYTVTESDNAGYTVTSENDKGTIEGGKTADVKFTNTKSAAPTVSPSISPSPTPTPGGGNGGGGHSHYYPTTTPVPVIVIPPKTGDMTIWQSILHFLGIR